MEYLEEIRNRCYNKMIEEENNNNMENAQKYRKLGMFLSDPTCFMKLEISASYNLLMLLDFNEEEIDKMFPSLISYNTLFSDKSNSEKKK